MRTIGSPHVNVGLFVKGILTKPELRLPARYVLAESDAISTGNLVKLLGDVSGKPTEYLQSTGRIIRSFGRCGGQKLLCRCRRGNSARRRFGVKWVSKRSPRII